MAAKFDEREVAVARKRCSDISTPRPRSRPQGRLRHHRQRQAAQEGYRRRRQGAAIAAARREAAEAKVKAAVLLTKIKTMEATLSRVAAMLPSLERLQRRENAAATKIQAAIQGCAARKRCKQEKARLVVEQFFDYRVANRLVKFFLRLRESFTGWRYWVSHARPWERTHLHQQEELRLCPLCVYHEPSPLDGLLCSMVGEAFTCQGVDFDYYPRSKMGENHVVLEVHNDPHLKYYYWGVKRLKHLG